MKISLCWLADHIDADIHDISVSDIVESFNKITAEIEQYQQIVHDPEQYVIAQVEQIMHDQVIAYCPEYNTHSSLGLRSDLKQGQLVLLIRQKGRYDWATLADFGYSKHGYVPAIFCDRESVSGTWRSSWQTKDVILDIDNKSINHRPDLWSHRGIAREIAAQFQLPLKPLYELSNASDSIKIISETKTGKDQRFSYIINTPDCTRFAALYLQNVSVMPSQLWMAHRLMKIDARPINTIVDITNYVMFDLSQPMHAFDARKIDSHYLQVRNAHDAEQLHLLDNQVVRLQPTDMIISTDTHPISLAGIMGGSATSITDDTHDILLESAHFRASVIRRTSHRLAIRTNASTRFEKTLDVTQNIQALVRALQLMHESSIQYDSPDGIISIDTQSDAVVSPISFSHEYLEQLLGNPIDSQFVINTLKKLEFGVIKKENIYHIDIPSFRAKDIKASHDVIEEIIRFYGFTRIVPRLPARIARIYDYSEIYRLRAIKQYCAYSGKMREVYSYAFYDEHFLQQWGWQPEHALEVQDPVSAHYKRLVTSLIPNLIKAAHMHIQHVEYLRLFEAGRVWVPAGPSFEECKHIAGLVLEKGALDFYSVKDILLGLCDLLKLSIEWQLVEHPEEPWFEPCRTASLIYESKQIGMCGVYNSSYFNLSMPGNIIIFWLDQTFLQTHSPAYIMVRAESKFPEVERDISMVIADTYTVAEIQEMILAIDDRIVRASLIDFFRKNEWLDRRSVTMRCTISDQTKTLTKQEIDFIMHQVIQHISQKGAEIR